MARFASLSFFAAFATLLGLMAPAARAVAIATVPVGNAGNAADTTGFGAVAYNYRIGATEVTNAQYVEFLNAVAASDPYELFPSSQGPSTTNYGIQRSGSSGSYTYSVKASVPGQGLGGAPYTYEDKPVNQVTWVSAIRFANWLHNGQGSGSTETGAYTLLGGTSTPANSTTIARNVGAKWFLPNENEWYKSAYHGGGALYYDFATQSATSPNNNPPSSDTGNSANVGIGYATGNPSYPFTPAGAYSMSESFYGTFDQTGNVAEWTESHGSTIGVFQRIVRGGAAAEAESLTSADARFNTLVVLRFPFTGFRVAMIPEPGSALLAGIVALALTMQKRK